MELSDSMAQFSHGRLALRSLSIQCWMSPVQLHTQLHPRILQLLQSVKSLLTREKVFSSIPLTLHGQHLRTYMTRYSVKNSFCGLKRLRINKPKLGISNHWPLLQVVKQHLLWSFFKFYIRAPKNSYKPIWKELYQVKSKWIKTK